jgi:hypothetical protein
VEIEVQTTSSNVEVSQGVLPFNPASLDGLDKKWTVFVAAFVVFNLSILPFQPHDRIRMGVGRFIVV